VKSKLAENTVARLIAAVLDKISFLFLAIYFTRYIGASIYGEYILIMSLMFIFKILVNFGLSGLFIRDLSRDPSKIQEFIGSAISLSIGLCFVFYAVLCITVKLLDYSYHIRILTYIAGLSLFPFSMVMLFEATLYSIQDLKTASIWTAINSVLTTVSCIIIMQMGYGLRGVMVTQVLIGIICALGLRFTLVKMKINVNMKFNRTLIYYLLNQTGPFALFTAMCVVYTSVGIVLLSKLETNEIVGWYGAPLRIMEALLIIPASFGAALSPIISRNFEQSIENLWHSYELAIRFLVILALPLGIGIFMLSKLIVPFLFGPNFLPSVPVMSILALATIMMFINGPATVVIFNSFAFRLFAITYGLYTLLTILGNIILIKYFSYIGAAIGKLATEMLMFAIQMYFLRAIFRKIPNIFKICYRPFLATLAMAAFLWTFDYLPLFLLVVCGFLVYSITLVLSGEVPVQEITQRVGKLIYKGNYR
jgi:O-antigen/teichoic acid export membrane protein